MSSQHLVKLENLSKHYGEVVAVDDISLSIEKGEFLVLLGPSGSGKTTILSMLGGFTNPSSGKVFIAGEDVTRVPPAHRPTVTVFQDYALFPHMSVRDNVGFGLAMRKVSKPERTKRVDESLNKVGLEGFGDRGVHQLSGGQRQRVALARAIAVEPAVLLLDEPLGALDLKIRHQMQTELVHLQKTLNATFVHVTHDQEEALRIADKIALINHGIIEDYGSPERVYLRPSTLFSAKFMGESNVIKAEVKGKDTDRVTVSTPLGQFNLPCETQLDRMCNIVLRPEQIRLGGTIDPKECISLGEGRVTEIEFQGTHRLCRVRFEVQEDIDYLVRIPPDYGVSTGDRLALHARESDAVVLSD
ncbi:MAG: ABC transporter ATP-binding protein [Acidiferrobacterales bacterium]|nr:ABC transporter ATP-binding protein [Acidiferrobacterales bacterium]